MSNERIDITEMEERLKLGLWTDNTSLDLIAELKRSYKELDDLKWNHMQVLRERKDLRDSGLSMAKKADFQGNRIESLIDALRIIRDDLDEAIAQGHLPIKSADGVDATKIRNFANDASQ